MAEDLMKSDGKSAENVSPKLQKGMQEEVIQFLVQLDAMLMELEEARKNELADERQA
jgi:hypothetical protein